MTKHAFRAAERQAIYRVIAERRDMRRFVPDARGAEGLGMGWVSIFEPGRLAELLRMPDDAEAVAILCLGPVPEFTDRPALESDQWAFGRPLAEFVSENGWATPTAPIR